MSEVATNVDPTMVKLLRLSENEQRLFSEQEITTPEHLQFLTEKDINKVLRDSPIVKRKQTAYLARYLLRGHAIEEISDMTSVVKKLFQDEGESEETMRKPSTTTDIAQEVAKDGTKPDVDILKPFCGDPVKWETWQLKASTTLGQTAYAPLLDQPPPTGDLLQLTRDREFYFLIKSALIDGQAGHMCRRHSTTSGHAFWMALNKWFGQDDNSRVIIDRYRTKLHALRLDQKTPAYAYINDFDECCAILDSRGEGMTDATKVSYFINQILSEDYQSARSHMRGQRSWSLDQCYTYLRQCESDLIADEELQMRTKSRRTSTPASSPSSGKAKIPSIPSFILNKIRPNELCRALVRWRGIYNDEGRILTLADTDLRKGPTHHTDKSSPRSKGSAPPRKDHSRPPARKSRKTSSTRVSFQTDESDPSGPSDEDDAESASSTSSADSAPRRTKRRKRRFSFRLPLARRTSSSGPIHSLILDSGTEIDIAGGSAWHVTSYLSHGTSSVEIDGALAGGPTHRLPLINAVTLLVQDDQRFLIGIGGAAYDPRPAQCESLVNPHVIRAAGHALSDVRTDHGGSQDICVGPHRFPLSLDADGKLLQLSIRAPTPQDLTDLSPIWLTPPIVKARATHASLASPDGPFPVPAWDACLGQASEMIVSKTLANTTQLCAGPVEMDTRGEPRQHRKPRLTPLHVLRLPGRTDSDTFFSSLRSIRKFTCVQLFIHLPSLYMFLTPMRREKHSHSAYQDFLRYVGAPATLLTDNAATQTGAAWTHTSRQYLIRQIHPVPHNQQQNQCERAIRDVKRRSMLVLRLSGAPLPFWCYVCQFVADTFNYTARKALGWRTPVEILRGTTPDISLFRFPFWAPILYYEPTTKFPQSHFLPGRFIGIAWDHGDQFSYRIWTCPDGDWHGGRELIRNIVRWDSSRPSFAPDPTDTPEWKLLSDRDVPRKRPRSAVPPSPPLLAPPAALPLTDSEEPSVDPPATKRVRFDTTLNAAPSVPSPEDTIPTTDQLDPERQDTPSAVTLLAFTAHQWKEGRPLLKAQWSDGDSSWEEVRDLKRDHPLKTAQYVLTHSVSRSQRSDRLRQWARKVTRDYDRAVRRISRLFTFSLNDDDTIRATRRAQAKKKRKHPFSSKPRFKYGVQVPNSYAEAVRLDHDNGNTLWQDATVKEMTALDDMNVFEYRDHGFDPGPTYQRTTVHLVFDVKQDLRRKARCVAGGHLLELLGVDIYSSTVKSISVKLIQVIAHRQGLELLCGDVGNAYVNAFTEEKVFFIAGKEFGAHAGKTVIISKALYGLVSSSERWHAHFADALRGLGFEPSRFDNDVWLRLEPTSNTYEYICTHVDDFLIASKRAPSIMADIQSLYTVKDVGPPGYYLGNDYKKGQKCGRWFVGCVKYLKEAISRVEALFGTLAKRTLPTSTGDHPEEDDTPLLLDADHRKFQMLIGMLNWIVSIGRFDIAFATMSLSRFSAAPRQGHLRRALNIFGYLKRRPNRRFVIDSSAPRISGISLSSHDALVAGLLEKYPGAEEPRDPGCPPPLVPDLPLTAFVDSDHAHDKVTRRSVTGILVMLGRTPIFYYSKRQGAIETSTYGAEFVAMKTAVEEITSIRYMLRCLGVSVSQPTYLFGDNLGVIQNATLKSSLLKKKHVAISYHKTRESVAAGIVIPIHIAGEDNFSDVLTKSIVGKSFARLVGGIMHG